MPVSLVVDGRPVEIAGDDQSLLAALRDELGVRSPKDGCSPQGQCGCCTVLVDGVPRVSCVTAVRRVAGRRVTTADGLEAPVREALAAALSAHGGSQCGFCTPGIICRLAALGPEPPEEKVTQALLAHLCRCTGWRGVIEAATSWRPGRTPAGPPAAPAAERAAVEGRGTQMVGAGAALGRGGFADDAAPTDALVAVPDPSGGWATGETLAAARQAAGRRQGRRSGRPLSWPVEPAAGDWALTLRTTWVEPGYLEPDSSWCRPGGEPASPLANGGAFGGKRASPAGPASRRLADLHGRPVRVVLSREDVVRLGPKRPPLAVALVPGGAGVVRVARTDGIAARIAAFAPGLVVEEVEVTGPTTSADLRAAGWAEVAAALCGLAALESGRVGPEHGRAELTSPDGATASARVTVDASGLPVGVAVELACGEALDATVLRSYATGAAHMALGLVCSEALAVDPAGAPEDLTIRSFGILRARDTPPIDVTIAAGSGPAVNGSDAVFAAVAAATWIAQGLPGCWPTRRGAWR